MKRRLYRCVPAAILALLTFVMIVVQPVSALDNMLTDHLYSRLRQTSRKIMLITIDEATLGEYGSFSTWSRDKTADVLNLLYADPEKAPAVVGIDILFQGETDPATDAKLAEACSGERRIVPASAIVFSGAVEQTEGGTRVYNAFHVENVEYPFDAMRQETTPGYTNAFIGKDGVNRYNMTSIQYQGEKLTSFAGQIADLYCEATGNSYAQPKTDSAGRFRFFYSGLSGEYQHVSMKQVLSGKIPAAEFKNKIVLIGAYATGMQDAYRATADVGTDVYGVEIQANIIQALLDEATAVSVPPAVHGLIAAAAVFLLVLLAECGKLVIAILLPILCGGTSVGIGWLLAGKGFLTSQLYVIIICVLTIAYFLVKKYMLETKKRRQIIRTFGRYMEPRLVEQLAKENAVEANLGGSRREVAVLFVDIRGFTSMSELLQPEQVVEILNAYLGHVTECIFRHHGMLDKFIGDATMAVFNAPVDQEDYLYEAVATAWDIANGSKELEEDLIRRFGRSVGYGVGVNCGPAVVGNIGCDFRMDYTAIGDTVNTASRLEGSAARGEILISDAVYQGLKDRIQTEYAGKKQFKGKSEPMDVYRVTGIGEK